MDKPKSKIRDQVFLKLFFSSSDSKITEEEVEYFRENPREIDEFSAPLNIHKFFLFMGTILGVSLIGFSKFMKFSSILHFITEGVNEFLTDLVFETGVALISAAVTVYLLGILLNKQQSNAKKWRKELRKRIKKSIKIEQ